MDAKTFQSIVKSQKTRTSKLALRCALYLDLSDEFAEEKLLNDLIALKQKNMDLDELNSGEFDVIIEAVQSGDKSLRKYLPAQTLEVGFLVYGSRSFVNAARIAIIVCLTLKLNDVSFFINKKMVKLGVTQASEYAEDDEVGEDEVEVETPPPPIEKKATASSANRLIEQIRELIIDN